MSDNPGFRFKGSTATRKAWEQLNNQGFKGKSLLQP